MPTSDAIKSKRHAHTISGTDTKLEDVISGMKDRGLGFDKTNDLIARIEAKLPKMSINNQAQNDGSHQQGHTNGKETKATLSNLNVPIDPELRSPFESKSPALAVSHLEKACNRLNRLRFQIFHSTSSRNQKVDSLEEALEVLLNATYTLNDISDSQWRQLVDSEMGSEMGFHIIRAWKHCDKLLEESNYFEEHQYKVFDDLRAILAEILLSNPEFIKCYYAEIDDSEEDEENDDTGLRHLNFRTSVSVSGGAVDHDFMGADTDGDVNMG